MLTLIVMFIAKLIVINANHQCDTAHVEFNINLSLTNWVATAVVDLSFDQILGRVPVSTEPLPSGAAFQQSKSKSS